MKVLFTKELFPPYIAGGGEIYGENIVRGLMRHGVKVQVVAGSWGKSKFENYEGIPVHRVNLWPMRYSFNVKGYLPLLNVAKKFKPDVIHSNAPQGVFPAFLVSRQLGIPHVVSVHFLFLEEYFKYFNPATASLFYALERSVFRIPYDKIIALDHWVYRNLCRLGLKKNSVVIQHPIDTRKFKPQRKKHEKIVIGTVGTFYGPTKGTNLIINTFEKLKEKYDVEILVVGKCTNEQSRIFERIGAEVVGRVPHNETPKYYNKIDIFIGQGMSAKEAMACGCVTILNEPTLRLKLYHKPEIVAGAMLVGDHFRIIQNLLARPKQINKISKESARFVQENYRTDKIISQTTC